LFDNLLLRPGEPLEVITHRVFFSQDPPFPFVPASSRKSLVSSKPLISTVSLSVSLLLCFFPPPSTYCSIFSIFRSLKNSRGSIPAHSSQGGCFFPPPFFHPLVSIFPPSSYIHLVVDPYSRSSCPGLGVGPFFACHRLCCNGFLILGFYFRLFRSI